MQLTYFLMRYIILILVLAPIFGVSQGKHTVRSKPRVTITKETFDGYIISGNITGYPDGTPVSFINDQTGVPEKQSEIRGGKFVVKGKMDQPAFKTMVLGDAPPAITIFLDNSKVKVTGEKASLDKVVVSGSPSHALFESYLNSIKPYEKVFMPDAEYDSVGISKVSQISEAFARKNPNSFITPLAIIRLYQASENGPKAEQLYNLMPDAVKNSSIAVYLNQQIQESKINPLGSVVPDFTQSDTSGIPVNISSYRGKYVLVDFWASWCRPCRQENPNVVAAYNKFNGRNFTILGISMDQAKPAWMDAIKMDNLKWSQVSDLKGWANSVAGLFHITSIPQNLLLDPSGKIIAKNLRGSRLDQKLDAILKH